MPEFKTAAHFKSSPEDAEGIDASLEAVQGKMLLTFSRPVESIVMSRDELAAMNHAFGHAAIWLSMHEEADKGSTH